MYTASALNRDRFNDAASILSQYSQPPKRSWIKGALKKIFLGAVVVFSVFAPQRIANFFNNPPDITPIVEIFKQPQQQPPPQQQQQPAQPVEQQAETPYVSQLAGTPISSRGLTSGETQLVRSVFGNKIDLNGVRVHTFAKEQRNLLSDVGPGETKNIEFYGRKNSSDDFSKAGPQQFGSFMHEMTYLLQNQGKVHSSDVTGYDYPLSSQWSFGDYGPQQQRAIVQDYCLRFLHPARHSRTLPHTYGGDRMDTDPFLIRLVEDQFPAAKQARINFQNIEQRGLTQGEIDIIKGIFGEQVDTRIMTQNFHPEAYTDVAGTAISSRSANFWGPDLYSKDFSHEKEPFRFGVFVHENTHLWQFQTNFRYSAQRAGVYKYPVEPGKWSFNDYTDEQQAAIMEDYATYYLHPSHEMRWLPQVYSGAELQQKAAQMRDMVETRFPGAKHVRETYEAQQRAARTPVAQQQRQMPPRGLAAGIG